MPKPIGELPGNNNGGPRIEQREGGGQIADISGHGPSTMLFIESEDVTDDACRRFDVIDSCIYITRSLGGSENLGSMGCDCAADVRYGVNRACDDDSDCINRITKIECLDEECGCGTTCQNQRFQRRKFAEVSVIKTEKKGFGLRADRALPAHAFVYEYIGEVINESTFRKRMPQYSEEGIKHFYFMSLSKGVFVDATKKGNLGRFCNHSCRPNCYVDKWVVGDKLRMGIFTERDVQQGEELVFNYNVDRYGADPQPCYCGETSCVGFIGGRTQTERATKLSTLTIEALGLDDNEAWDTMIARKPRKKKVAEGDEDYVERSRARQVTRESVEKLVAAMILERERWVVVSMLERLQLCQDETVLSRVAVLHGYNAMNAHLLEWDEDAELLLQILNVLFRLPRLTKNKIEDANIEPTVRNLIEHSDETVRLQAVNLLAEWAVLERGYRIPRKKKEIVLSPSTPSTPSVSNDAADDGLKADVQATAQRAHITASNDGPPLAVKALIQNPLHSARGWGSAPRAPSWIAPRRFDVRVKSELPRGWNTAFHDGQQYYYSVNGKTTWQKPVLPDEVPPPPPPPVKSTEQRLQDIVDGITKAGLVTSAQPSQAQPIEEQQDALPSRKSTESWRKLTLEKQKKLYENSLSTVIREVMRKYHRKLSREDLKRFGREIGKQIVESDYKHSRVKDPTKVEEKQRARIIKYATQYFEKAVFKRKKGQRTRERGEASGLDPDSADTIVAIDDSMKSTNRTKCSSDGDLMEVDETIGTSWALLNPRGSKRKALHEEEPEDLTV